MKHFEEHDCLLTSEIKISMICIDYLVIGHHASGYRMKLFLELLIVFGTAAILAGSLPESEELCRSFRENGMLSNRTSEPLLQLILQHTFLEADNGILPELRYNVTLRNSAQNELVHFAIWSDPVGEFNHLLNSNVAACSSPAEVIVGTVAKDTTFIFTAPKNSNESLIISLATFIPDRKPWSIAYHKFAIRTGCYYIQSNEELTLLSEELAIPEVKSVLIQSPKNSGLHVNFEDVIIPADGVMLFYNVSETSPPIILSYTEYEKMNFLLFENKFLLIDLKRCLDCRFRIIVKLVALKYECNSTLSLAQGSLELLKHFPPRSCELILQAPPAHRVLLKISESASANCSPQNIILGPLAGVPAQEIWTSCNTSSNAQTEFYISESNSLRVYWDGNFEDVWLRYEYLPQCSNRTFADSTNGQFCSTGYPDIIFECNMIYSIYVPFGYSIELKLSLLGVTNGAFCQNNTLQVISRNSSRAEKLLLGLCFDENDDQKDMLTLHTPRNSIEIRIRTDNDLLRRGFCATYRAIPDDPTSAPDCPYGWVPGKKFCYKAIDERLNWMEAEEACQMRNGHLASITDNTVALLIDDILKSSPFYERSNAFWIGANDLRYENCYEWTDGQPFDFFHWFPGWENYGWYGVQPSDDGLSQQNCVELRNLFRYPSKGEGITERYYWNDRDCHVANPFICQKLKPGVSLEANQVPDCNRTITLSWEQPREILTSPLFPNKYPNSIECHYYVTAGNDQRIVALFTDFILEDSQSCKYDVLTVIDDGQRLNRCGDWENKIKLLRHVSFKHTLHFIFSTDFSHSYKGFRIELSLLEEKSKQSISCDNDMFQLKGKNCYLIVNYPETSWTTARQICSEAKAKLAIVENIDQVTVLDELVRTTYGYMSGVIYWVGAFANAGETNWNWLDGSRVNLKNMRILRTEDLLTPSCLAIQWKQLRSSNALRWTAKNCNHPGRFICQKPSVVIPEELNKTVTQLQGNLTSVNYPSNYLDNLDYIVEIIGPPNSRVVLTFHHFDLEWQEDCLYDYVLLQNDLKDEGVRICGEYLGQREFMSTGNKAYMSFHSDFSITSSGYMASWEIVDLSACLNRRLLILEPTAINSLRYPRAYLPGLECRITVIASEITKRLLITIGDLDLRSCAEDYLEVNLDPTDEMKKLKLCIDDLIPGTQLMAYGNEAQFLFHTAEENSMKSVENRGYNFTCETWGGTTLKNTLYLKSKREGRIYSMNFNHSQPIGLNYSQRVVVPVGYKIHLKSLNVSHLSPQLPTSCDGSGIHIHDKYATQKTLFLWNPCRSTHFDDKDGLWSTLHVLNIDAWNFDGSLPLFFLEYFVVRDDHFVNTTITLATETLESCRPNPCQHGGRCIKNGTNYKCHCFGQYTGLFCHVTWCEVNVCGENGACNLTANGWTCDCLPGFAGSRCQQRVTPCSPNPCGENGKCSLHNGTFACQCELDYEGTRCEKFVMRIPYKPLSQRMLEEPFWLGLITVFSVLAIILLIYCIKRKFADKIEKFFAHEIERTRYHPSPPPARYGSNQQNVTPAQSPQTVPKTFLGRIRKNSLLSASNSPSPTPDKDASRTFSFDGLLRKVSSKKGRTSPNAASSSSTSGDGQAELSREEEAARKGDETSETSRILSSLVTPSKEPVSRRMSLDEFIRMSERKLAMEARRTNSTDCEGQVKETSFINMPSPRSLRRSFSNVQRNEENSGECVSPSSSGSTLDGEPNTSEIQADISPIPANFSNSSIPDIVEEVEKSPDHSSIPSHSANNNPSETEHPNPVSISITIDKCESDNKPDSESDAKDCDIESKSINNEHFTALSPIISQNSSYLEVPKTIPAIQVISAESDEPQSSSESPNFPQGRFENCSPSRKDFIQPRKLSVDLPPPKILISNMNSLDSDEASPPRTPNPNKSMMYLSPLAVISSSTDRTISESNLSTSGYSSISSPGLSRCNSSSPISDEVDHHHRPNCTHKTELQSPKKPHTLQMAYLSVAANEKAYFFPQTIACHCHTPNQPSPGMFEPKNSPAISSAWTPGKHRTLGKRNSYQTTSTDDSIDDEGIGMDTGEFKGRKNELNTAWDVDMYVAGEQEKTQLQSSGLLMEPGKPELHACLVGCKSGNGANFKGSPRAGTRKTEKPKKYGEKHRRSPVLSPIGTPIKDSQENLEVRIPRNSSRTSMSGPLVSSSESDDSESFLGARQKSRRSKKHDAVAGVQKPVGLVSMPSQDSSGPKTDKSSDATGRSSPLSESNGDSAPMDSRSPVSSSSESLSSTRDSTMSEKAACNRRKLPLEHTRSFPPLSQCSRINSVDETSGNLSKIKIDLKTKIKSPVLQIDSEEEVTRSSEDHPYLRRQEAVIEDEPSDDSSSETTVLLGRQSESPRNLQQSSSADVSEWEAFNKE
ncbi:Protocadherin Fat 1 like protein [Argiope bruennichi]|uniref:Protocadherin Fat 1 like protein n=1 Tax=Argiope bruennichi TaxID=94029 RepID=A0A8T0F3P0_ARGBR|nr:Protocadherin Fat 1 like protein [Argiope bruennichi]